MFARLGAEGEMRDLAAQGWDDAFAPSCAGRSRRSMRRRSCRCGRYAELLSY